MGILAMVSGSFHFLTSFVLGLTLGMPGRLHAQSAVKGPTTANKKPLAIVVFGAVDYEGELFVRKARPTLADVFTLDPMKGDPESIYIRHKDRLEVVQRKQEMVVSTKSDITSVTKFASGWDQTRVEPGESIYVPVQSEASRTIYCADLSDGSIVGIPIDKSIKAVSDDRVHLSELVKKLRRASPISAYLVMQNLFSEPNHCLVYWLDWPVAKVTNARGDKSGQMQTTTGNNQEMEALDIVEPGSLVIIPSVSGEPELKRTGKYAPMKRWSLPEKVAKKATFSWPNSPVISPATQEVAGTSEGDSVLQENVVVMGEVARPGKYPFKKGLSVTDYIVDAGGLTPNADAAIIYQGGKDTVYYYSATKIKNQTILPGSTIVIPRSDWPPFTAVLGLDSYFVAPLTPIPAERLFGVPAFFTAPYIPESSGSNSWSASPQIAGSPNQLGRKRRETILDFLAKAGVPSSIAQVMLIHRTWNSPMKSTIYNRDQWPDIFVDLGDVLLTFEGGQ